MGPPDIPAPAPDPTLEQQKQQAQNSLVANLQKQTQGDMATLMARYGTQLAMAGTGGGATGSPLSSSFQSGPRA